MVFKNESRKKGWIFLLINGGYAIIYSLILGIFTEFIVKSRVNAAGIIFESLEEGLVVQYLNLTLSNSYLLISFGIFTIFLGLSSFKAGYRLAWFAYFLSGGIGWFGLLVSDLSFGSILIIGMDIFGIITYILAVLIPMKSILLGKWAFSKNSKIS